ncbi:MAG: type II toxin-antitoxin system Phd/YefM family antitoxin [Clostridia bacterium]|nr:type II toxin-antitoxin system Phd/YefM family antitoxin [Clostridia bacterium]
MLICDEQTVSVKDACRDFSEVIKLAEQSSSVVLLENGSPRYKVIDLEKNPVFELTEEEKIDVVAKRVLKRYKKAFEVLAE